MYYKIENQQSEVFQKLKELRINEKRMEQENKAAIKEKIGLEYNRHVGNPGQQTFDRVTSYSAFEFLPGQAIDPKVWKKSKNHDGSYEPNSRTKKGREMSDFLRNGLQGSSFSVVFEILGFDFPNGRFSLPYVELLSDNLIVLFLDEKYKPNITDIIEITSVEFEEHCKIYNNNLKKEKA